MATNDGQPGEKRQAYEKALPQLSLRVDDFSWQGICKDHPRLFFRRLREPQDNIFTDLLIGEMQPEIAVRLLAEFIRRTGPFSTNTVTARDISSAETSREATLAKYEQVTWMLTTALREVNVQVKSAMLDHREDKFDIHIVVSTRHW
ncbi:hypothetical protein OCH239_13055 [Roseivivax halodurans JCM 10272]|uniref:Uncharacterized protein n=1 Tax=Roseivivax halodurans JCM 10272 TaxID=1449350 RepID=X7ED78_9RHOB|nr:hypothetical protein [Roseivivax halodurans]ETX13156.1 hypothetical protein OCH239_13055 [Roseivivax halodurans JCM 10272]